jgi:hypothetical protein
MKYLLLEKPANPLTWGPVWVADGESKPLSCPGEST